VIAALDFEFSWLPGSRPWDYRRVEPICGVIKLESGEVVTACPMMGTPFSLLERYLADASLTFAVHHYHAEWHLLRSLGLPLPVKVLDCETAARFLDIRDEGFLRKDYDLLAVQQRAGFQVRASWWKEEMRRRIIARDFSDLRAIIQYCSDDVGDTLRLAQRQLSRLDDTFWELIQPLHLLLLEIYDRGLCVDWQSYKQLQENAELLLHRQQRRLIDLGYQGSFAAFEKLTLPQHNVDVQRTLLVVGLEEILDELPVHARDVDRIGWQRRSVANLFKSKHHKNAFLKAVSDYHSTIDLLRFDWRQFIDSDYRIRFGFSFPGTSSYRISPRSPHPLQLPKQFRPVLVARDGYAIVEIDYSCQEFGLAGAWFGEQAMVRLFNSYKLGGNLYAEAGLLMGVYPSDDPEADPFQLERVKVAILSLIYGAYIPALTKNLQCSDDEALALISAFHNAFPRLNAGRRDYLAAVRQLDYAWNAIDLRRKHEYFRLGITNDTSLSYWNFPIQSGAAAILARVLFDMPSDIQIVASCHDAILIECPEKDVRDVVDVASRVMTTAMDEIFPGLRSRVKVIAGWRFHKKADSLHKFCAQFGINLSAPIGWICKP